MVDKRYEIDVPTDKLLQHYIPLMRAATDIETLEQISKEWHNVYHIRKETEQLPLRQSTLEAERIKKLELEYMQLQALREELLPDLIQKWCDEYSERVAHESVLRHELVVEVVEALPQLYRNFKLLFDAQEALKQDDGTAQLYAMKGYKVSRSSGYSLPWGKPGRHATTEREIISAYLLATVSSALNRGQLTEHDVSVDAVLRPQALMFSQPQPQAEKG